MHIRSSCALTLVVWLLVLFIRSRREEKVPVDTLIDEVKAATLETPRSRSGQERDPEGELP